MQRAFSLMACGLLAGAILWADTQFWRIPGPDIAPEVFASRLEAIGLDPLAPPGWRLGGAWKLRGHDRAYDGLSGLAFDDTGALIAVTDDGLLVRFGEIGEGDRPVTVRVSAITNDDDVYDAEAVTARGGAILVGYEGRPGLVRRTDTRVQFFRLPGLPDGNRGVEALFDTGNRLFAIGEDGKRAAWFANGRRGPARLSGATDSPTGAARWPGRSDGLLLQRSLGLGGFRAGVSTISAVDGARLEAGPLQPLGLAWNDNAEGIAIRTAKDGYEVWIVTDNNAKAPQRTILVRYDVASDGWPFDGRTATRP